MFAPSEVHRLSRLKKAQIAAEAERLAAGSGWLPVMFRKPEATSVQAEAGRDTDAGTEGVEDDAEEEAHATA